MTEKYVEKLQSFFGNAIRQNLNNVESMKNAIMATYYHHVSTDRNPQHHLCPDNDWRGSKNYKCPGKFKHKENRLPVNVFKHLKPFYESLCDHRE